MRAQRDSERTKALAALDGSGPGGIRAAMMGESGDAGAAIKDGGDQAAQSIKLASATIGEAGGDAGSAISGAAASIVSAGEQVAAAIRSAARDLMRPVGSLGRVNADVGRSGPAVEGAP